MLLGEPQRTQFDLNFSLFGIPVRVHPLFWLVTLLLGSGLLSDVGSVLAWIIAVFLAIMVHELGHAAAMRAYGFRPWIVLYGLGGATAYDPRTGTRSAGSDTLGQVLISFAGPLAGFLLAGVIRLVFEMLFRQDWSLNVRVIMLLGQIYFISVVWGVFNLLPVYPLDGGQIAREILLKLSPIHGIRVSLVLSMSVAVVVAVAGFVLWRSWYLPLLFGYLAYASYTTLQAHSDRRPW